MTKETKKQYEHIDNVPYYGHKKTESRKRPVKTNYLEFMAVISSYAASVAFLIIYGKLSGMTFEHMMIACMFTFLMQLNVQFLGTAIRHQRSKDRWSKWDGSQNRLSYNKIV